VCQRRPRSTIFTPGGSAPLPDIAAETLPPKPDPVQQSSRGGDFMVDLFKIIGFDYVIQTPTATFRDLHEAPLNHGMNTAPEILSCVYEEIAVAMANGYAIIEGKPVAVVRNPVNDMPAYPITLLSYNDLTDICAFPQALPGRRPAKDIPILNN
jgi:hypothetical protein